jgi:hypothetical protein
LFGFFWTDHKEGIGRRIGELPTVRLSLVREPVAGPRGIPLMKTGHFSGGRDGDEIGI